jgi:hypothetical protein
MGARGVIAGQVGEAALNAQSSRADLDQIHRGKTGALFLASVLIPRDLSGLTSRGKTQILEAYGKTLGEAFQIMDDLEDAPSDGARAPHTSILAHLSPLEAARETVLALRSSQLDLVNQWGKPAQTLASFADEIIERIERSVPAIKTVDSETLPRKL